MSPEEVRALYEAAGLTPPGVTIKAFSGTEQFGEVSPSYGDEVGGGEIGLAANVVDLHQTGELRLTPDADTALDAIAAEDPDRAAAIVGYLNSMFSEGEIQTVDAADINELSDLAYLPAEERIELEADLELPPLDFNPPDLTIRPADIERPQVFSPGPPPPGAPQVHTDWDDVSDWGDLFDPLQPLQEPLGPPAPAGYEVTPAPGFEAPEPADEPLPPPDWPPSHRNDP